MLGHDYLSQEKYDELQTELNELRLSRRKEVAERLEFAKSLGDLSENAEYHSAREEQSELEDRINQLENLLKTAEIIKVHHSAEVEMGSVLTIERLDDHTKIKLMIVGSEEADAGAGKISGQSPMGAALLGRKPGEAVEIKTPRGEATYKIISID